MPNDSSRALIERYFHTMRQKKRKPMPGEDRLVAGIVERARERAEDARLDELAERDAWERGSEG
jgi:hypothetical protein